MNDYFFNFDLYVEGGNIPTIKQVQIQCKYSIHKIQNTTIWKDFYKNEMNYIMEILI
jgi:hypothetical protein